MNLNDSPARGKLTEADFQQREYAELPHIDVARKWLFPACTGPCQQGKYTCATPDACHVWIEPRRLWPVRPRILLAVSIVIVIAVGILLGVLL